MHRVDATNGTCYYAVKPARRTIEGALMKLHEYQARDILATYGIPVTGGGVASTPAEARAVAERIGRKVVVKAQVFVGGRGKAGGVKLADTPEQAEQIAGQILGMDIKGLRSEEHTSELQS